MANVAIAGLRNEMAHLDGCNGSFYEEADCMDDECVENECGICGDDHETRDCDQSWCRSCGEILDNCDCEEPDEADAEEWDERRRPFQKAFDR